MQAFSPEANGLVGWRELYQDVCENFLQGQYVTPKTQIFRQRATDECGLLSAGTDR